MMYKKCCTIKCSKIDDVQEIIYSKMLYSKMLYSKMLYRKYCTVTRCTGNVVQKDVLPKHAV